MTLYELSSLNSLNSDREYTYVAPFKIREGEEYECILTPPQFFWEQMDKIAAPASSIRENEICLVFQNDKDLETKISPFSKPTSIILLIGQTLEKDLHLRFKKSAQQEEKPNSLPCYKEDERKPGAAVPYCWVLKGRWLCSGEAKEIMLFLHQVIDDNFFTGGFILPYGFTCWSGIYNKESDAFLSSREAIYNGKACTSIFGEKVDRAQSGGLVHGKQKIYRVNERVYQQNSEAISKAIERY